MILFLDVDGVINPCDPWSPIKTSGAWRDWVTVPNAPAYVSPEMGRRLAALDAEIVWLTTWEDRANRRIVPVLGWDECRWADRSQFEEEPWWKLDCVLRHVNLGRGPFIWIDDQIDSYRDEWSAAFAKVEKDGPGLLISPTSEVGITISHLKLIEAFIAEHSD